MGNKAIKSKSLVMGWLFSLCTISHAMLVDIPPSFNMAPQTYWPLARAQGWNCIANGDDNDAYLFSSPYSSSYYTCKHPVRRVEAIRLRIPNILSTNIDENILYSLDNCEENITISFKTFLPSCKNIIYNDGSNVNNNFRSIRIPGGRTVRMFSTCHGNTNSFSQITNSDSSSKCFNLNEQQRSNTKLFRTAGEPSYIINREIIGNTDYYDYLIQKSAIGQEILSTVQDCTVNNLYVYFTVSNEYNCHGQKPGLVILNRDLSWKKFIQTSSPMPSAIVVVRNNIFVACSGYNVDGVFAYNVSNLDQTPRRLRLSMEYSEADNYGQTSIVQISSLRLLVYDPETDRLVGTANRWGDALFFWSDVKNFGEPNSTKIEVLDTMSPSDSITLDISSRILYTISEHRISSLNLDTFKILPRDVACGTTALEVGDNVNMPTLISDPKNGYIYGFSIFDPSGMYAIRQRGIELESIQKLIFNNSMGRIYDIYSYDYLVKDYSQVSTVYYANVSILIHHENQSYSLTGTTFFGGNPSLVFLLDLNGCVRGRAGSNCNICQVGYYAEGIGNSKCLACSPGKFTRDNESFACSECDMGKYSTLSGATSCIDCDFGSFADFPSSTNCKLCPLDHFHLVKGSSRQTDCKACPEGSIAPEGSSSCEICPLGRHKTDINTCTSCFQGFYGGGGSVHCSSCPLGKFGTGNETVSEFQGCESCPNGRVGIEENLFSKDGCQKCSAGKYKGFGDSECKICPEGTFSSRGATTCTNCQIGKYSKVSVRADCLLCPAGRYGTDVAAKTESDCSNCSLNTYSNLTGTTIENCKSCHAGKFTKYTGSVSSLDCINCALGTIRKTHDTYCQTCRAGLVNNANLTSCIACEPGKYEFENQKCLGCPPGTYNENFAQWGIESCERCESGSISTIWNSSQNEDCTKCSKGTWAISSHKCESCSRGLYNPLEGQTSQDNCLPCPSGKFSSDMGLTSLNQCTDCPQGKYGSGEGRYEGTTCQDCVSGRFSDKFGAVSESECKNCIPGRSGGGIECAFCKAGFFSISGQSLCTICPKGKFANNHESLSCESCPENSQPTQSKTACECSVNYYCVNISITPVCEPCPPRANCEKLGTSIEKISLKKGFWRYSKKSLNIRRCDEPLACVGGVITNSTDDQCRKGHTGPLCDVCVPGHAKTSSDLCAKCPKESIALNIAVTILAPVGIGVVVVIMVVTANANEDDPDDNQFSGICKITSSLLQIYSVCSAFDVKWPSLLVDIFEKSDAVNPSLGFYSAQCSFGWTFFQKSYVYMAMPIAYVLISVFLVSLLAIRQRERKKFIKHWVQTAAVVGLFLMYTSVIKPLLRGLACKEIGNVYYMTTDLSIKCYQGDHLVFIPLAITCLVLYGIGIPAISIMLLWRWRHTLYREEAKALQFLHRGYRRERFYWEAVVLARKVIIISMSIFLFTNEKTSRYQSPVASWFFVGCLILHLIFEPFEPLTEYGRVCHILETAAIVACICTLNAGIIFGTRGDDYAHGDFEMIVLILTIIVNTIVAILFSFHITRSGFWKVNEKCKLCVKKLFFSESIDATDEENRQRRSHMGRRLSSLHVWAVEQNVREKRAKEIELANRNSGEISLGGRLRLSGKTKLLSLHAKMEENRRKRLFEIEKDLKIMEDLYKSEPDSPTLEAFVKNWESHLQEINEKMKPLTNIELGEEKEEKENPLIGEDSHSVVI